MKLEDAVIAVTGGASGLGAATAQLCVERGAKVAVLDMNQEIFSGKVGCSWGRYPIFLHETMKVKSGVVFLCSCGLGSN